MPHRCLLLALGNDILKDDGVGLAAVQILRPEFQGAVDIMESPGPGLALLELLEGYDQALLLDAIFTGNVPPGTILEFHRDDFQGAAAPEAHFVGLPEVLRQAERLGMVFPQELRILALEVDYPFEDHQEMSPATRGSLPGYVDRARQILRDWLA
jgi:hydrogenase maturation protease